jgi:hypothetical protein
VISAPGTSALGPCRVKVAAARRRTVSFAYHWTHVPIDAGYRVAWAPYLALPDLRHLDATTEVRDVF